MENFQDFCLQYNMTFEFEYESFTNKEKKIFDYWKEAQLKATDSSFIEKKRKLYETIMEGYRMCIVNIIKKRKGEK